MGLGLTPLIVIGIILNEPSSSEVVAVGIFVVQLFEGVADVIACKVAAIRGLSEGKPSFEQLIALENDVDLG